jgi:predicted TIM-barrel fold metal-dependent hydrolase
MSAGAIIDCDVHTELSAPEEILPYLGAEWHAHYLRDAVAFAEPPGSDPAVVRKQLIEPLGIERAILSHGRLLHAPSAPNPYFTAAIASAANDWLVERWLAEDTPFYGSVLVANQLPELAAAEIRRVGGHPRMVQVVMADNAVGHPWGHTLFHPIYEAAEEFGLPVAIQAGAFGGMNPTPTGGGVPSLDLEYKTLAMQGAMSALVSFVTEGVFDKYPGLRLVLLEAGLAWVPGMLWRFDADFKGVRREVPWVKRLPSEYFREHVRLTTQPLDIPAGYEHLTELLEEMHAGETLMFASDYPSMDVGEAQDVGKRIPEAWRPNVMGGNALATFRWPDARED